MAIGRISGSVLKSNLTRNGVDLAFETNLLYLDVTNSRVGIGTSEPSTALHVVGDTTITGALSISGALTAGSFSPDTISVNNLYSTDSTAIQVNDGLNVAGTLTANTIQTNSLSSTESTAIQVNDSLNASGTITATSFVTHGTSGNITGVNNIELNQISSNDSTAVQVADGMNVSGTLTAPTFVTNDISSGDSSAIQINDALNVSGTLTANGTLNVSGTLTANGTLNARTIVTNDISSEDSTAVQINDGMNVSGTLNAKTIVTTNISSEDSTAVSINDGLNVSGNLNVSGTAKLSGFTYPTADGTDGQVLTTNGAGTLTFTTVSGGGGGGGSSATDTITYTGFGSNNVVVDSNVTVGSVDSSNSIGSAVKVFDSFAETAYDSAFYFATTFNDSSNEVGTRMVSLLTDGTTAYNSPGIGVDNGTTSQISFSSNQTGTTVALNALGNSSANTATFHRIGLGTNTTEATSGNISTIINNDINNTPVTVDANVSVGQVDTAQAIGSSTGVVDSFAPTAIDSAFYFAVTEDTANDVLGTVQISLVHNTADAYVASGAVTKTDLGLQLSFSAGVTSGNIRLSATGSSPSNTTRFYKIGLGDSTTAASSGNTATILNADVDSSVENLDSWSATTYRGARYYISCTAGNGEVSNIEALVVHNGTDAYISTFNEIYSGNNSIVTLTADISAGNVRLRASCATNTSVKCYRIILGDAESTATTTYNKTVGAVTVSSSATAIDTFSSSSYAVAHYVVVACNSDQSAASISDVYVVTDGTNAFVSNSSVSSKTSDQLIFSVSHDGSDTVTLSAASTSGSSTTVNAYRTQLARADTLATATNIDSWSKTSYRGAKYFISIKATDINEVNNMEAMITHDGTNAYISVYNEVYSGSSKLATLTADISGSNVVLNASSAGERNITFTMYRVLLSDAEETSSGTYNTVIEATTVSSANTALDTFSTASYVGAHYIVVAYNSSESAASISEVFVASDGTTASVASNFVSSKNSAQLSFSVDCSGGTVTLSAASTSGSSTTVNAYRTHLGRPPAATGFKVIDSWSASSYRMAKYIIAIKGTDINEYDSLEATIMHDGSDAYISTYNLMMSGSTYSAPGMITFSADVSEGLVRLKGVSAGEQNMRVTAVRHRVPI